jgi:hypothetical protein
MVTVKPMKNFKITLLEDSLMPDLFFLRAVEERIPGLAMTTQWGLIEDQLAHLNLLHVDQQYIKRATEAMKSAPSFEIGTIRQVTMVQMTEAGFDKEAS